MAFTCGFFNSQNGDRKYNAEQMASIFDGLIEDGVYDTIGEIFAVTPGTGMQVLVGSGRAWFDHTWNNNDAPYPLAITAADVSLPRYDAVVLETNHSDTVRTNRLRVLTGTPASNPVKPTMTSTANVKQHPLAYIKVTAGATAITQSMIQVVVGTSECPFVTGIIETAQIDALFQQWNGEFNEWFENLKAQLSDNVVANLQGQIDQKVAKADVATAADIDAGTSNTKWVSPKVFRDGLKHAYSVGDILTTTRTNLDDSWALCNGSRYNKGEYPALFNANPYQLGDIRSSTFYDSGKYTGHRVCVENNIVVMAAYLNASRNRTISISWSTDYGETWSNTSNIDMSNVPNAPTNLYGFVNDVCCHNGIAVVACQEESSNAHLVLVCDLNKPSPTKWVAYKLPNSGSSYYTVKVRYFEGKWRIFYTHSSSVQSINVYSSENPKTSAWTSHQIYSANVMSFTITDIQYLNNKYVILFSLNNNPTRWSILYTDHVESIWKMTADLPTIHTEITRDTIDYVNGHWIIGGWNTNTSGAYMGFIYSENDNLDNIAWRQYYCNLADNVHLNLFMFHAYYKNSKYYLMAAHKMGYSVFELQALNQYPQNEIFSVTDMNRAGYLNRSVNGEDVYLGYMSVLTSPSSYPIYIITNTVGQIPEITQDRSYSYIKTK